MKIFSNKLTQPCPRVDSTKTSDEQPLYFPQSGDELPAQPKEQMDAIGPWATGRVTFTPQDGLTGVRPVVDRYSITSFGAPQWRAHNQKFFMLSNEKIQEAQYAIN